MEQILTIDNFIDNGRKGRVLVVDDIIENLDLINGILKNSYQIIMTQSGEEAIKLANSELPDIILLDIMMPGMDGYEVCRILKSTPATQNIPVIFITTKDEIEDESRAFQLGAVDYITKPVSPPIVNARVKTHIMLYNQNRILEEKVRERTSELNETRLEIIRRLSRAAEFRDNETGIHVIKMSRFSQLIALGSGYTINEAELVLNAAPMHDVGKIGINDRILLKEGPLTTEEWDIMKEHPTIGYNIIGEHHSELLKLAASAALTHHEKWNGAGYPNKLKEDEIPEIGRITAIADVFDALTSDRPYKKAWEFDEAVNTIKEESGKHFDPRFVKGFFSALPEIRRIKEEIEKTGSSE